MRAEVLSSAVSILCVTVANRGDRLRTWEHVDDETIERTENPDPYVNVEDELLKRHGLTRSDVNII